MRLAAFLIVATFALQARGESTRVVDAARLRVGDLLPRAPAAAAGVDLGPAPPPGGSRLLSRDEIVEALRRSGLDPKRMAIPSSVRVTGASRVIEPDEIASLARAAVERELPSGVRLIRLEPACRVVVSPRTTLRTVRMGQLPRQKGMVRTTAGLEWVSDDRVVASSTVGVIAEATAAALAPDVPRGASLLLVIERNGVKVTASGVSLVDARIGDTVRASVGSTGKVVSVRVVTRDKATVIEQP